MTVHVVTLPDVGEGVAEAELVRWLVAVGDAVTADTPVAEVMTDKATVELYAGAAGTVSYVKGAPGDTLAVGSDLLGVETQDAAPASAPPAGAPPTAPPPRAAPPAPDLRVGDPFRDMSTPDEAADTPAVRPATRPTAAPAVRQFARDRGVDLHDVDGSGPEGRVLRADIERHLEDASATRARPSSTEPSETSHETPIIGLRRRIAQQMTLASSRIPHVTYVDEVDVTELESLRQTLNRDTDDRPTLTPLPFIVRAVTRAVRHHPELNSTFDDERGVLTTYDAVHVGIATQTADGLIVPVVRDADALDLWDLARAIARSADAARDGSASAPALSGSTITVTSLGALGGIVSTPIINHPEVAIVGINKIRVQPVWNGDAFMPRQVMNLSSSFDHRIVDGWVAANFVQRIKAMLESPALLFIDP